MRSISVVDVRKALSTIRKKWNDACSENPLDIYEFIDVPPFGQVTIADFALVYILGLHKKGGTDLKLFLHRQV